MSRTEHTQARPAPLAEPPAEEQRPRTIGTGEPEQGTATRSGLAAVPRPVDVESSPSEEQGPVVSVVIVSYQCKRPLLDCLASLEVECANYPLEVIVVDNDSSDGTGYEVAVGFPWVDLIVNRGNEGFARAVNRGMRLARGKYILVLNPDTVVPPGTVSQAVEELERHSDVGMLGCKLVRPDGSFDHACKRRFPTIASAVYYFSGLAGRFPDSPRFAQYTAADLGVDETGTVDAVNGAFMLVRSSTVAEVGPLDERYWLWAEDLDWCHRFWERGWKVLYWPEVEVTHLKSASVGEHRSLRLNFAFHRSIWLFYKKHHAPHRSRLVTALVGFGVWSKFVASAIGNGIRVARSRAAEQ